MVFKRGGHHFPRLWSKNKLPPFGARYLSQEFVCPSQAAEPAFSATLYDLVFFFIKRGILLFLIKEISLLPARILFRISH